MFKKNILFRKIKQWVSFKNVKNPVYIGFEHVFTRVTKHHDYPTNTLSSLYITHYICELSHSRNGFENHRRPIVRCSQTIIIARCGYKLRLCTHCIITCACAGRFVVNFNRYVKMGVVMSNSHTVTLKAFFCF